MGKNGQYKISIEQRLTALEVKVDEIISNHIVHLEKKLDRLTLLVITTLISIIITFIAQYLQTQ